jgi:plasmid stabilization system protein ParE
VTYTVRFLPEAVEQLAALYRYVADASSRQVAADYVEAIRAYCEGLAVFPYRGTMREDLRPGLRVTHFRRRVAVAIVVDDATEQVTVLGIFAGGQDYDAILGE